MRRLSPPTLDELTVARVGYRGRDHWHAEQRVDLIDRRLMVEVVSLTPDEALQLAEQLRAAAGGAIASERSLPRRR